MSDDISHILFPSDAPKQVSVPDYVKAETAAAELRLSGRHPARSDQADRMFPSENGKQPEPGIDPADDTAAKLFADDVPAGDKAIAEALAARMEGYELDARLEGDEERANELQEAMSTLTADFSKKGTAATDVAEMTELLHEGKARIASPTEDEAREAFDSGIAALAEGYSSPNDLNADIRRAQRFVSDLAKVTPGVIETLERSGMGSDPRMVRLAIREARRRGY